MNAVRGAAALVVVLAHAIQVFILRITGTDNLLAVASGQMATHAVYVFFIVSGYLITQSIFKNYQRNGRRFDAMEYLVARVARIYPPLIFAIVLTVGIYLAIDVLSLPGGPEGSAQPLGLATDLYRVRERFEIEPGGITNAIMMDNGLLQANGPLWSLCIEWRVYLVAGALGMAVAARTHLARIVGLTLTGFAAYKLRMVNENYLFYACVWLIGSSVALLEIRGVQWRMPRHVLHAIAVAVVSVAVLFPDLRSSGIAIKSAPGFALQLLLCLCWAAFLFPLPAAATPSWVRRQLMRLGDYSYTLFIIHFPIMLGALALTVEATGQRLGLAVTVACVSLVASLLVSAAAARFVENKTAAAALLRHVLFPRGWPVPPPSSR